LRDRAPGDEQSIKHRRRDFALIKREPDRDREPARFGQIRNGDLLRLRGETKRSKLNAIGLGIKAEAAGRRQAGAVERREIRRLGPEPVRVQRMLIVEGN